MKFSRNYTVQWHDTDAARRVRPSRLLVYMQETSSHHVASTGLSLDELRDRKSLAFILSKIRLAIHKPLGAFEEITVETWTNPSRGFSSGRSFRILRGDEVIAEADTTWALVDTEERKLHKMEETGYQFEDEAPVELDLPARVRFPAGIAFEKLGERAIVYSDLDYNMHMNNTRYPDMLCDYLPLEEVGRIRGMTLSYLREAAYGDVITVLGGTDGSLRYFRTVNSEGATCLEAVVVLGEEN